MVKMDKSVKSNSNFSEPLAIIGMNCLFPGMNADIEDCEAFHAMLMKAQTPIKEVPPNRWNINAYYDACRDKTNKIVSRKGGFLEDPYLFDADFFKISPVEAKQMDPQHRLFLEVAIRALNHANISTDTLAGSDTAVYCGLSTHEYNQLNIKDQIEFNEYTPVGVAASASVGRLCHYLNLKGQAMAVDTACSSSLSALYLAANALRTGQCQLAIVGGVHLNLCPENFIGVSRANMLSARGQCSSFDSQADGYVRSEGAAVVIVKRLSDAIKDGDTIQAVIKSLVMNQDGGGISMVSPNVEAQIAIHRNILADAAITPEDIDYIETHGTGTVAGDTVEFKAIETIHQGHHSETKPLIIGALKSNLGHTISCSGLASLIKVISALKHENIPPNLHFSNPNKSIHPEIIPALFPITAVSYKKQTHKKRIAQVTNFGFSGTNVSLLIEEAPEQPKQVTDEQEQECFVISANSENSLLQMLRQYPDYLKNSSDNLHDICLTLINCRNHYKFRCAILAKDKQELVQAIESTHCPIEKVTVKKDRLILDTPKAIYQQFMAGHNIKTSEDIAYNKVNLPLYCFDKKHFYHEPHAVEAIAPQLSAKDEPIAIIGMSCRFPKAPNLSEFLSLLEQGISGMDFIPLDRWDNDKFYDPNIETPGKLYVKQLGLLDNIKQFDANFFNISPREAKFMSPQLRIFMECSYHALEHANLSPDLIKNSKTGVFVGIGTNEYPRIMENSGLELEDLNIYFATGNVLNALAGRVAYAFDLHGPVQVVDTACSSSMTAIHNACLSLQAGDCSMAIAGGVNVILTPNSNITLSKAKMLSPDSRCKTFSEDADGYARSEGCGVIILKPLQAALKDKDTILAVIKGTAINSSGKSSGFTVPNGIAQEEVIRRALAKAKLNPEAIDYIEAHGTGTPLADPIEMNTLTRVFSSSHSQAHPLYVSSVKTNIGHSESASGVAGVIKTVLSLQNERLFKHLNFKKLNPEIELKNTVIPLETIHWPDTSDLKRAGVSSFGFSGANAHAVIEQAPERAVEKRAFSQEFLLILSAKSQKSLELLIARYEQYLSDTGDEFADICYTAATCRGHYLFRTILRASTAAQAASLIRKGLYLIYPLKKEERIYSQPLSLDELQTAWQEGSTFDWQAYYQSLNLRFEKVNLPLYEFDRQEYWFENKSTSTDTAIPDDWCFQLQWQTQALNTQNTGRDRKRWLLIGASELAAGFKNQDLSIIKPEENYSLKNLDGVIFAASLRSVPMDDIDTLLEFQKNNLKQLLNLVKELDAKHVDLKLIVLSHNGIAEFAGTPNLGNSSLAGFCKTLTLELPQFESILIDFDELNIPRIVDEIHYNHGGSYEHIVAYRQGKRLISRLKKIPLTDEKTPLNPKARYLISGGLGGLGLISAQALLASGARELILLGRNPEKPGIEERLKTIQLNYPDARIKTISLDITDSEKLKQLLIELNKDGLLKGIIHAAGAAVKASVLEHQHADVDYLFSAKVEGSWNLHELSQNIQLDFFIGYSSISSVFGSNKESVYSATNSFLDALMSYRRQLGLPGTAIQWGPWGEAGMSIKRARDQGLKESLISNAQGQEFIRTLLHSGVKQLTVISPKYLQFMLDFVHKPRPLFYQALAESLEQAADEKEPSSAGEPIYSSWLQHYVQCSEDKRLQSCKALVTEVCREILEISAQEPLDEDEGFFEIGFDSLMMTELASLLRKKLEPSLKLAATIGFDYPSISKLAQYIHSELGAQTIDHLTQPEVKPQEDDIAIIGMSCSFPKAADLDAFEALLEQGLSGIQDIPVERWDNRKYYDPNRNAPGKSYVSKMGLIDNIKGFDASFFGISPREAKLMDPQQRLFLECSYKALEHANYPPESLRGSLTGVFAGVGPNEYYASLEKSGFSNEELSTFSITGNVLNLIPGRVAYIFDFKGPSLSIDTSCSSALVAIHYACTSLKNGEIDYALAGGVNVLLMPESNVTLCRANALSPDGQCKTFDAEADGYARGEGCGVLFLKRLADAIRDKDAILAVIKASAVNNDGKAAGLTVPNGKSQEAVMLKALKQTGLSSEDISYIEAHGTGTPLGDPIEVHAIHNVYGQERRGSSLYLGSVKTNIGHLEAASGVAGMIKTVIGLQNKKIYKHLNFKHLNPNIKGRNPDIALQTLEWISPDHLRYAGVNSFGFSGTNAHVILQEFPDKALVRAPKSSQSYALILSAKSPTALEKLAERYQRFLKTTSAQFGDICFTAATCRDHYAYRLVLLAKDPVEAAQKISDGQLLYSWKNQTEHLEDTTALLKSLLLNYLQGKTIDWASFYHEQGGDFIKVKLPHYYFERAEYWADKKNDRALNVDQIHPLLGQMLTLPDSEFLFNQKTNAEFSDFLEQYQLFGKAIFPAAASIECGLSAAKLIFKESALCIEQFNMASYLAIGEALDLQLQVKPTDDNSFEIRHFSKQNEEWQLFSTMSLHSSESETPEQIDIEHLKSQYTQSYQPEQIYEKFKQQSLNCGKLFQVLQAVYINSDGLLAEIRFDRSNSGYYYHPALLDGIMQSAKFFLISEGNYLPCSFARMTSFQEAPKHIWAHFVRQSDTAGKDPIVNIKLYDHSGLLIARIEELVLKPVSRNDLNLYEVTLQNLYETQWQQLPPIRPAQELPEYLVIASDPQKAVQLLGDIKYRLFSNISQLMNPADKNIIFLYEQGQFYELVHCCQQLFKSRPQSFVLLTENAHAIHDGEQVNPYHSMANAFWRSFRNEWDFSRNFTVDLDDKSDLLSVLPYLLNPGEENQFTLREGVYVPRIKRKELGSHIEQKEQLFDNQSSCLITGGTGALAADLIDYLIERGAKHIIITSRSPCPPATENLIETARLKQVTIRHYQADASNYQQMEALFHEIQQKYPPLTAVFHLAGIVRDGLIINLSDEDLQTVLSSKMDSALILHQLSQSLPLKWFILFSSTASLLGARGQANYVAANGFLDGLAHFRKQQGLPALSINWGPFNAKGMTAKLTPGLQQFGFIPLEKENLNVLDCLLNADLAQIAVCRVHWDIYLKHSARQVELSDFAKNKAPVQYFFNALRQRSHAERTGLLSRVLCEITADVLALDNAGQIRAQSALFSLGVDSLMSIEIRNRIHDKLQCPNLSIPIEYFINDPSIEKIAENISQELQLIYEQSDSPAENRQWLREEVPLCDFQFSFWSMNTLNYGYNTSMQLQLHGRLNKDYVNRALDFVINQHAAFWLQFNQSIPTQTLKKRGEFRLIYKDISLNNESNLLRQEFYNNTMRLIELDHPPLVRAYLYKLNNDLHELHLVLPHIIVDDASCDIVFAEFRACYEALFQGKSLVPKPEKKSFLDYVKNNNSQYQKDLDNKISFWQEYNQDCHYLYFGAHHHLPDAAVYRPRHMHHYTINPGISSIIEWHAANNLNISSGLIAICQMVFHQISQQQKIPIILIHTGREGSQYKSTVGLFSEYKRINLSHEDNISFIDRIKSVENELLKTAPFQRCSYFIKNTGINGSNFSISKQLIFWWNKWRLGKSFKEVINEKIVPYYLDYLSQSILLKKSSRLKLKLKKLFKWQLPLQKPDGLKVLINITASVFGKEVADTQFADLHYSYPSYFGGLNRPIGNQNLWIYFSRNAEGDYQLSINGPLTLECMAQIACRFNEVIDELVKQIAGSQKQ
ncbi:SDR family NAD(P)-dependent oxidoreductase [Legionella quinlivanii]|uniref:SDR family NAD(P)-dependent oxidoreductase n=1 Tax=Legionella quinlivanii TaxID=45073 RepID=UPI003908BAD9